MSFAKKQSREGAQWRGARVSRLEDEGVINYFPIIESERGFATGFMAPGNAVSIYFFLAAVALRSGSLAIEVSVGAECDRLPEKLNRYKM